MHSTHRGMEGASVESRTRLAIGGITAVAVSVAVICAVALTNSVALSDAEGSSIDADGVVVPSSGIAASGDTPATPGLVEVDEPRTDEVDVDRPDTETGAEAEVVPAPAPEIVASAAPRTPPPGELPASGVVAPSDDVAIAEAEASGSWSSLREWAARRGWSTERIDEWIEKLEKARAAQAGDRHDRNRAGDGQADLGAGAGQHGDESDQRRGGADRRMSAPSAPEVAVPGPVAPAPDDKKKERTTSSGSSKERPANAGANADHRSEKPGVGAKKDRSRDSPERGDR